MKLSAAADFVFLSLWRPHVLPLYHTILFYEFDPLSSEVMNRSHLLDSRGPHSSARYHVLLFTDARHFGWGAHIEPIRLSFHGHWAEDKSQLHINILEIMVIRFAFKKGHTLHPTVMCHDINRQHDMSLVYQQTRTNPFSEPMYSMGNPSSAPKTRKNTQNSTYTREIQ